VADGFPLGFGGQAASVGNVFGNDIEHVFKVPSPAPHGKGVDFFGLPL
jgi:hypothetical protein